MKKIFLLLILINVCYSQNIDWKKVHDINYQGIEKLYALKISESISDFEQVIKIAPKDPRGYFFKAMAYYYRYFLLNEEEDYQKFIYTSELVINICEDYLDDHEDAQYLFYLGGIKGYRGISKSIHAEGTPPLSVLKEGKEAYSLLKKSLEINPNNYDTYMGLGLFTYMIGSLPRGFKWVASILGFQGSKELGIKYLKIANEKGLYTKYEALWWLTFIYSGAGDEENAAISLNSVLQKFPNNNLYNLLMGNFNLGLGNVSKAIEYFNKASKVEDQSLAKLANLADAGIAICNYYENDFNEAIQRGLNFITKVTEKEDKFRNRDNVIYFLGLCYELSNNPEKAKEYYSKTRYNDLAKLRMFNPLTNIQKSILINHNIGFTKNYKKGNEELQKLISVNMSDDEKGFLFYYLGELSRNTKNYQTAIDYYKKVFDRDIQNENYLKPYSHYYIAFCYSKLKEINKAKSELEKIKNYKKYSNQRRLERMAERLEDNL